MSKLSSPPLRLLGSSEGTWWDMRDHKTRGQVWLYLAEGLRSGQWTISVKIHQNEKRAIVKVVGSEQTSFKHAQFWGDRKNHDFEETKDGRFLYHLLGIGHVGTDWRGRRRVRSKRQMVRKSVPKQLRHFFRQLIRRHDQVSPKTGWAKRGHPLSKSLVVMVPKNRTDLMAWSYVLEKLQPLFHDRFIEPTRMSITLFA